MRHTGITLTLLKYSTAGNQPEIYEAQTVEIHREPLTVVTSVDGITTGGSHPWEIIWFGGTAKDLTNTTHVKIVDKRGEVLVDGELITTFMAPKDVANGVRFDCFAEEWKR
jgi:hypothetical protein